MTEAAVSIDQTMIEAMRAVDYTRPAIVRPYLDFGEMPSAAKALKEYYQDKSIDKKMAQIADSIAKQERRLAKFLQLGVEMRSALGASFAENKNKIEPRHIENLKKWAEDLEQTARETSAEEAELLKKLDKNYRLLARKKPKYKKDFQESFARIFAVGKKKTEEAYDMALFLRALRAEYGARKKTKSFTDEKEMAAYLEGLVG